MSKNKPLFIGGISIDKDMWKDATVLLDSDKDNKYWDTIHNYQSAADNYVKCSCGGFTTYGSMEDIYHSRWCIDDRK